jgi:hypothetical protein
MLFFAGKRFFGVCATTFSANRAGICTHIAGQLAHIVGTRRAKKIHCPPLGRGGRSPSYFFLGFLSYATLRPTFFGIFFLKYFFFTETEGLRLPFPLARQAVGRAGRW